MAADPLPLTKAANVSVDCDGLTQATRHRVHSHQQVKWYSSSGAGCVITFENSPFDTDTFELKEGKENKVFSGLIRDEVKAQCDDNENIFAYEIEKKGGNQTAKMDPELDIRR